MVVVFYRVLHSLAVTCGSSWDHCVCVWNCLHGQQCTSVSKPCSNTNDSTFFTKPIDFLKNVLIKIVLSLSHQLKI